MQQPVPGSGWHERLELVLEGGGQLPGAIRVVDIRDQVLTCSADRQDDMALVRGQLQVFVYYNIAGNDRVQGQSAEIPWHCEVPIPPNVQGQIDARVVEIRHDHAYDPDNEQLRHTMHLTFEVWSIDAQPADTLASLKTDQTTDSDPPEEPVEQPSFDPEPDAFSDENVQPDDSCDEDETPPLSGEAMSAESESLSESDYPLSPGEDELQLTDVVVADTATTERLDELESYIHQIRRELSSLHEEIGCLRGEMRAAKESAPVSQEATEERTKERRQEERPQDEEDDEEEDMPEKEDAAEPATPSLAKPEAEILIWRPFPRESP
ncbi:MAG: hypothetical protein ACOYEP_04025 [Limnochordia bacterium]|jgi:hypothetical protein